MGPRPAHPRVRRDKTHARTVQPATCSHSARCTPAPGAPCAPGARTSRGASSLPLAPNPPPGHPSSAPAVSPARPTPATKYAALPTARTACRHTPPAPRPQAQPTATQTLQSPPHRRQAPRTHASPAPHSQLGATLPHLCPRLPPPLGYLRHLRQDSPSHPPAPGPSPSRAPLDTLPGACGRIRSRRGTPTWPGARCEATELGTSAPGSRTRVEPPALPRRVSPGASAGSGPGRGDANLC